MRRLIAIAVALAMVMTGLLSMTGSTAATAPGDVLLPTLTPHGRIVVNGPSDFTVQGFTGSGSLSDPYVLDGVEIDAAGAGSGIVIGNTTSSYFEIRNVRVINAVAASSDPFQSGAGIVLYHAEKGKIVNCDLPGNSIGVGIFAGGDILVSQSSFSGNNHGVWIFNTQGTLYADPASITLYRNYFSGAFGGHVIYAASASWLTIDGNVLAPTAAGTGIMLENCSTNVLVEDNVLTGYPGIGVELAGCDNTTVRNNNLLNTVDTPILISGSPSHPSPLRNIVITRNNCSGPSIYGLSMNPGTYALIGATISENTLSGHYLGIYAELNADSHSNTIERNRCLDNLIAGIELHDFQKGIIRYNTCQYNGGVIGGYGLALYSTAPLPSTETVSNRISNNDLSFNKYPLWIGADNNWNIVEWNDCSYGATDIHIESSNNIIRYNTLYNSVPSGRNAYGADVGIQLTGRASYNTLTGNIISIPADRAWGASETSTTIGIEIRGDPVLNPSYNAISYNQLLFCTANGIDVLYASYTDVSGNTIMGTGAGIDLLNANLGNVSGNNIYPFIDAMADGIILTESSNNMVSQNRIDSLSGVGICIRQSSNSNTITENWVSNSGDYGIWLGSSKGNRIFLNAFDHNSAITGLSQSYSIGSTGLNFWSSGAATDQGNYWSDWSSPDAGPDGYVDSPYVVGGPDSAVDAFPLTFAVGPVLNLVEKHGYETVHLEWDVPEYSTYAPATEYRIYRDSGSDPFAIVPAGVKDFIDTTVLPGESHTYKVSASTSDQENPISPSITVDIPTLAGTNDMTFTIDSPVGGSIQTVPDVTVTWTQTNDGTGNYYISIDNLQTIIPLGRAFSYTFTGLMDSPYGRPYTAYVMAENGVGVFEIKSVQFIVDTAAPLIISNLGYQNVFGSGESIPFFYYIWENTGAGIVNDTVYLDGVLVPGLDHTYSSTNYVDYGIATPIDLGPVTTGTHKVTIYSQDAAGHLRTTVYTFLVDDVAPILPVTTDVMASGNTNLPETTFSWILSTDPVFPTQALRYQVMIDGGDWIDLGMTKTYRTPTLTDGIHTFTLKGTDMAGHETIVTKEFVLDSVKPVITAIAPASGSNLIDGVMTISWTATDGDGLGIATHWYKLDNQVGQVITSSLGSQSVTLTGITTGTHTIKIWAVDAAGNVGSAKTISFTMDSNPPVTTAIITGTAGTNGWYTSAVSVELTAVDIGSGVANTYYRIGTDPTWITYTAPVPISTEGATDLQFYSVDNFGGMEIAQTVIVLIDTGAPTTSVALQGAQGASGWYRSTVQINLTADDTTSGVSTIQYDLDGSGWLTYTGNFTVTGEGQHVLSYRSVDVAGNVESTSVLTFHIVTNAPVTTASYAGQTGLDGWNTSAVTVTLTPDNPYGAVNATYYRLGTSGPYLEYTEPIVLSTDGIYVLEFYSVDLAGNVEVTRSATIKVDATAPTLVLTRPAEGSYFNISLIMVGWTGSDAGSGLSNYYLQLDDGDWVTFSTQLDKFIFDLDDGYHTVSVRATDVAGNSVTKMVNFTVDTVPPELVSHSPQGTDELRNVTVAVEFSEAMAQDSISMVVNGVQGTIVKTGTSAAFTPTSLLAYNTTYTVTVTGRDLAGNQMTYSWTFTTKAGTGMVTGIVLDGAGKPIANAEVKLANGPNTTTDSNGRYWMNATQGPYTMVITAPGMEDMMVDVFIEPEQTTDVGAKKMTEIGAGLGNLPIYVGLILAIVIVVAIVAIYLRRRKA